jgi:hypothetical protein
VVQSNKINIAGRKIGLGEPPFIIAEMSGNHNQSLELALSIVDAVAKSGAHALKIQTYTPDTMTLNLSEREFRIDDPKSLWVGNSLYKLYEKAHTPWEWHRPIFDKARELGVDAECHNLIDFLKTCKDKYEVVILADVLEEMRVDETKALLKGVKKICSKYFIISTPTHENYLNISTHQVIYDKDELHRMICKLGFKQEKVVNYPDRLIARYVCE